MQILVGSKVELRLYRTVSHWKLDSSRRLIQNWDLSFSISHFGTLVFAEPTFLNTMHVYGTTKKDNLNIELETFGY